MWWLVPYKLSQLTTIRVKFAASSWTIWQGLKNERFYWRWQEYIFQNENFKPLLARQSYMNSIKQREGYETWLNSASSPTPALQRPFVLRDPKDPTCSHVSQTTSALVTNYQSKALQDSLQLQWNRWCGNWYDDSTTHRPTVSKT